MKTSIVGILAAAILMLLAGAAFGIAQAGGNQPYDPMLSFGDQDVYPSSDVWQAREAVETGSLPASSYTEENMYRGWGNDEWGYDADVAEARGAVETGSLPDKSNADSFIVEMERDKHREGGDIGP